MNVCVCVCVCVCSCVCVCGYVCVNVRMYMWQLMGARKGILGGCKVAGGGTVVCPCPVLLATMVTKNKLTTDMLTTNMLTTKEGMETL
jgi:hypothetical protein